MPAPPDPLEIARHQAAGEQRYVVLPRSEVPDETRRAATWAADACSDALGLPRWPVRFFASATPERLVKAAAGGWPAEVFWAKDCLGVYRCDAPNAVYVKLTDSLREAVQIAAHETRHRLREARAAT